MACVNRSVARTTKPSLPPTLCTWWASILDFFEHIGSFSRLSSTSCSNLCTVSVGFYLPSLPSLKSPLITKQLPFHSQQKLMMVFRTWPVTLSLRLQTNVEDTLSLFRLAKFHHLSMKFWTTWPLVLTSFSLNKCVYFDLTSLSL